MNRTVNITTENAITPIQSEGEKKAAKTASFVLELPLCVGSHQAKQLRSRFEAGRNLYNALLSEALKRLKAMRNSEGWQEARALPNRTHEEKKARREAFKAVRTEYDFTEYALHAFMVKARVGWLAEHIDSRTAQALASRAFNATNKLCFGQARKVRFKSRGRGLDSLQGKSNDSGIRFKLDNPGEGNTGHLIWGKLTIEALIDWQDPLVRHGLSHRIKFVRVIRHKAATSKAKGADHTGHHYFVQLVLEGQPYLKSKNKPGNAVLGLDLGPQTYAVVSQDGAIAHLEVFCHELEVDAKAKRRLQRKLDRQRRASNPANFDEKGRVKKSGGKRLVWQISRGYQGTRRRLSNTERKLAAHRKSLHGKLANELVRAGNTIKIEKVSYRGWQKMFGKSVGIRAPGMFVEILKRTVARTAGTFLEFSTHTTKLSQVCHNCGKLEKKSLSQRWHSCECGIGPVQRDLYSGWLASHVDPLEQTLSVAQCQKHWEGVEPRLVAAMDRLTQQAKARKFPQSVGLNHQRSSLSA